MDIILISTDLDVWTFGLRSISAVLKAAGHSTRLIFTTTKDRLLSQTTLYELGSLTHQADIIGVSCLARGSDKAKQVIEFLHLQKKLVVWGGIHASLNPEECVEWADIVCLGEGEGMMLELLEHWSEGRDWKGIENIAYKENGLVKLNNIRPPICNLDKLPLPDFTFENEYHLTSKGFIQVSTFPGLENTSQIMYIGSRGCAFHCTYCCNAKLKALYSGKGRYIRRMSISNLIEHTLHLKQIFPLGKYFYFIDEDFLARPLEELIQFSQEFPKKVGLPFQCMTHPAQVNQQKMDLLNEAGLFRIHMGIESGSERTRREVFNRHVSNRVVKRATEIISGYPNIVPKYFFIIANPYEEREDLNATARFIASLPYGCYIQPYNLVFFPGSDLYQRAIQDGLIHGEYDSGYELDFLGGLNYNRHPWKEKNLYLNGIVFLMEGLCSKHFIGSLPRFITNKLLLPQNAVLNDNNEFVIKSMIAIKFFINRVSHLGAQLLRKIIGDPTVIYNLGYHIRKKVHHLSIDKLITK